MEVRERVRRSEGRLQAMWARQMTRESLTCREQCTLGREGGRYITTLCREGL